MTQTATLLLLFAAQPSKAEEGLLAAHARRQRITLVAPAPTPPRPYPTYRSDLVFDIEGRLDEARTLASSLDQERALALLAAIERDLGEHPELPQAAWLLAEHHRIAADTRAGDPTQTAEVAALTHAALVLEGARAPAFGAPADAEAAALPGVQLNVRDLTARDTLELDGVSGGASRLIAPGVHQVRVLRDGALVYARWLTLGEHVDVKLGVRPITPCSTEDLAGVGAEADTVSITHPIACSRWLVARRAPTGLELASCRGPRCSHFTPLVPPRRAHAGLPPWATILLAASGAAATGFVTAWASGTFEHQATPAPKTMFVYGGLR